MGSDEISGDWPDSDNDEGPGKVWDGTAEPMVEDFQTVDDFEEATQQWAVDERVRKSMAKVQPGIAPPKADHDDPHGRVREEILEEMQTYERELTTAELKGDQEAAQRWRDRLTLSSEELNQLPETPEVSYQRDSWNTLRGQAIEKLFYPAMRNDPMFNSPLLQNDSATLISDFNKIAKGKIALPLEASPFGDILPVKPQNMVRLDLSKAQMKDFQETVYSSGGTPDDILKANWQWIRNSGLETAAVGQVDKERDFEKKELGEITIDRGKSPKDMTQKQYEKWRSEGGGLDH